MLSRLYKHRRQGRRRLLGPRTKRFESVYLSEQFCPQGLNNRDVPVRCLPWWLNILFRLNRPNERVRRDESKFGWIDVIPLQDSKLKGKCHKAPGSRTHNLSSYVLRDTISIDIMRRIERTKSPRVVSDALSDIKLHTEDEKLINLHA